MTRTHSVCRIASDLQKKHISRLCDFPWMMKYFTQLIKMKANLYEAHTADYEYTWALLCREIDGWYAGVCLPAKRHGNIRGSQEFWSSVHEHCSLSCFSQYVTFISLAAESIKSEPLWIFIYSSIAFLGSLKHNQSYCCNPYLSVVSKITAMILDCDAAGLLMSRKKQMGYYRYRDWSKLRSSSRSCESCIQDVGRRYKAGRKEFCLKRCFWRKCIQRIWERTGLWAQTAVNGQR